MNWSWPDFDKILAGIGVVLTVIFGGLQIRRKNSAVGAANAQDAANTEVSKAEGRFIAKAIDELTASRNHWQNLHAADTQRLRDILDQERRDHADAIVAERKVSADLQRQLLAKATEMAALQAERRHEKSAQRFRVRALRDRYPDVNFDLLDSEPAPLGPPEARRRTAERDSDFGGLTP